MLTLILGVITIVLLILVFIVIIDLTIGAEPGPVFSIRKRKLFVVFTLPGGKTISDG